MDDKELQDLKSQLSQILPSDLVVASTDVKNNLATALEAHQQLHGKVVAIAEKITKAKKEIENDIPELTLKRAELIEENNKVFNDRALRVKAFEEEARRHQYETGELTLAKEAMSEKINAVQKNIDGLLLQKNEMAEEIAEFQAHLNRMKVEEQEVKNTTHSLVEKKNKASAEYSDIQTQIKEANDILQQKKNEIIIAQERINSLNK